MPNRWPFIFQALFASTILALACSMLALPSCTTNASVDVRESPDHHEQASADKHRGAHIFGYLDSTNVQPFLDCNINWITMVSWAAMHDIDSPDLAYSGSDDNPNEGRDSIWSSQMRIAHEMGFKVSYKPHIWLTEPSEGAWRNKIYPSNQENWEQWSKAYRKFMLQEAGIAERNGVELFCIGTELTRLSAEKPEFWRQLILDIKEIYSGKLTYAANWHEEYENITFWDQLDYIGIQAYFPLVDHVNPKMEEVCLGWDQYIDDMEAISEKFDRPILFTEMGYKSTPDAAAKPWQWVEHGFDETSPVSNETQANCYQAFFNTIWPNDWFAGVHIWQMRSDDLKQDPMFKQDFTPLGKPAEGVIRAGFRE